MSSQRYIPPSDARHRDRSLPRHPDRYPPDSFSGGSRNTDYGPRPTIASESNAPALGRDIPRGPKALVDVRRGSGIIAPLAPRGRGYLGRSVYRGDSRGQDQSRISRESPPRGADRDRSWSDRELDIRERRLSPQGRPGQGDFRDSRDTSQRDRETGRGVRGSGDGLYMGESHLADRRISNYGTFGRGGLGRGRARGDWNFRGRGRGPVADQIDGSRARSRSPDNYRWERKSLAEERGSEHRNEKYFERREDQKAIERDDREREAERWKKEQFLSGNDSRRPSVPSTGPSTPHPFPPSTTRSYSTGKTGADQNRDALSSKRLGSMNTPTARGRNMQRENVKSDLIQGRTELARDPYVSATSSPPHAPPQVPAFGSVSYEPPPSTDTRWNVWKAPDPKPSPHIALAADSPKAAKTAPPGLAPDTSVAPPKAPRADREYQQIIGVNVNDLEPSRTRVSKANELTPLARPFTAVGLKTSLTTGKTPEFLAKHESHAIKSPQSRPRHTSSLPLGPRIPTRLEKLNPYQLASKVPPQRSVIGTTVSPIISAPLGPRATTVFTSPPSLGANIPTGPKAERGPPQIQQTSAPVLPTVATSSPWTRPAFSAQQGRSGAVVPVKRDFRGHEKGQALTRAHPSLEVTSTKNLDQLSFNTYSSLESVGNVDRGEARRNASDSELVGRNLSPVTYAVPANGRDTFQIDMPVPKSPSATAGAGLVEEDDQMDLDEGDFADNEAKFEKEKALLESKFVDLSSRHLRATSPLEHLALLFRVSVEDLPTQDDKGLNSSEYQGLSVTREEVPVTKAEATEDITMTDSRTPPRTSPSPIRSPELHALPFLLHEPLTPISDLDVLQENLSRHEAQKDFLKIEILRRLQRRSSRDDELRKEYEDRYREWKKHVEQLNLQLEAEDEDKDPTSVPTTSQFLLPEMSPTILTAMGESRRQRGTEYEYEQMLKLSEESARAEQTRREKALKMPDLDKEAVLPELMSDSEKRSRMFEDTSGLRKPEQAINFYELEPPKDNFTDPEHETLVQNFKDYPKKWGKLAQSLPGRTYQECINHYYATKWNQEYKPLRTRLRPKNVKGKPKAGTSRANALISNLEGARQDMDEGEEFTVPVLAVTDSGRPKRAAAPTWGDKSADEQILSVVTPARKGARPGPNHEAGVEKATRKPRTQAKDKAQRKPRNQPSVKVPSMSPEKINHDLPNQAMVIRAESKLPENEVPNGPITTQSAYKQSSSSHIDGQQTHISDQINLLPDRDAQGGQRMQSAQQSQRVTTSSYWSRQENDELPALLEHFGQDWSGIANHMGTKTMTMVGCEQGLPQDVKNHYVRQVSDPGRKYLFDAVTKGDLRRSLGDVTGPPPTTTFIPRRRNDPVHPLILRTLAPSTDVVDVEDDIPQIETHGSDDPAKSHAHTSPTFPRSLQPVVYRGGSRQASAATIKAPLQHVLSRHDRSANQIQNTLEGFPRDEHSEVRSIGPHEQTSQQSTIARQPIYTQGLDGLERFELQRRSAIVDEPWHTVGRQNLLQPFVQSYEPAAHDFGAYYEAPKQQGTQLALSSSHLSDRASLAGVVDTNQPNQQDYQSEGHVPQSNARRLIDPPNQRSSTSSSKISTTRLLQAQPLAEAVTRIFPQPQQSTNQPPIPLRQEQRKTSNLAAILNAEPDEPKLPQSYLSQVPFVPRRSSPQASYEVARQSDHAHTQSARRDVFGNHSMRNAHQEPLHARSFGNLNPSIPFSHPTLQEPQSHLTLRPDWASAVAYQHGPSAGQSQVPRPFDRPTDATILFNRGTSLQTLQTSRNPSPPPGLEFHHLNRDTPLPHHQPQQVPHHQPQQVPHHQLHQVQQQSQIPVQLLQSNPYRAPPGPGSHLHAMQQNQQAYNHNSAQGLTEHRRRISENTSLSGPHFTEREYRARKEIHARDDFSALEQLRRRPEPFRPLHEQYQQRQQQEQQQRFDEHTSYVAQPHQPRQSQHGYDGSHDEERHILRQTEYLDHRRALGSSLMTRPSSTPANSVSSISHGHKPAHPPREIQSKSLQPLQDVDHARQLQLLKLREGQNVERNRGISDQSRLEMQRYEELANTPLPERRFKHHGPIPREPHEATKREPPRKPRRKGNEGVEAGISQ